MTDRIQNQPSISICMPAYQADRYLRAALDSIAAQSYPHWELVIVEDGSRDQTEEIVAAFSKTVAQPVHFLRHETNRGLPATRNTGLARARFEWIALLDSDDVWAPDHLAELVAGLARSPCDFVHSASVLFESDTGAEIEIRAPSAEATASFPLSLFRAEYVIQPSSTLFRRGLWERSGGFDPTFRYVEDRDMWLRFARVGGKFFYNGKKTCRYRKHGTALSTHSVAMAMAAARVFDKHLDWEIIPLNLRRQFTAEAWAATGRLQRQVDPAAAASSFRRALQLKWNAKWWLLKIIASFQARKKEGRTS